MKIHDFRPQSGTNKDLFSQNNFFPHISFLSYKVMIVYIQCLFSISRHCCGWNINYFSPSRICVCSFRPMMIRWKVYRRICMSWLQQRVQKVYRVCLMVGMCCRTKSEPPTSFSLRWKNRRRGISGLWTGTRFHFLTVSQQVFLSCKVDGPSQLQ